MSLQPFQGTARFELLRPLGSGTSGTVYEAWDRERGGAVALKLLHESDPASLYRFKREFRALAHLSHPNLIRLYELQHADDQWFFTMELVDGTDFVRHVRAAQVLAQGVGALEARLLAAARQLARGLRALHASGQLHCDVKPSNVLVDAEGKVVILDFGLVTKASEHQTYHSPTEDMLGTPAYMAPEQGSGGELTEATDWYGVGALVYEALTGRLPFAGHLVQVMLEKQQREPPPPRELVPELSNDLNELCRDLLRREPAARPAGAQVLARLGAGGETAGRPIPGPATALLVGRDEHLAALWQAFARVRRGEAVTLYVHGASGLGKSALVHRFLSDLRARHPDAVTLAGRCYEYESVPYKAFDSVIDLLTRYLRSLPYAEAAPLVPLDVLVLARLFPVLRRVKAVADARRRVLEIPDSQELRRRAFAVLRELLTRLAEDHPLVVFIDDLQWGDFDSAVLLSAVMREPDPPPMLLIGAYNDEAAAASPLVRELRPPDRSARDAASLHAVLGEDLEVGELAPPAAEEMVVALLHPEDPQAAEVARQIARDAHGNPLFIAEMVRYVLAFPAGPPAAAAALVRGGLDEVYRARLAQLPPDARQLLEVLAVAGAPIELTVARRAAELDADSAFTVLRVGQLARSAGGQGADLIKIYHDRIRKAVLAELDAPRLAARHRQLARELEGTGRGDPETLAQHFATAGESARALEYATEAAARAARALAFNRAARLYRQALDLESGHDDERLQLRRRLAEALVNAGRGAEAAEVYQHLAAGARAAEALEMRRRAAERWLVSGHVDRGLEALAEVLASVGWKLAATPRQALPGLLLRRAWLRLRGYGFEERDATQVAAEELTRIDTCWSAAIGLGMVDPLRGAAFQARHLRLALRAGEPFRVARALAIEVGYAAAGGGRRTHELKRVTAALVERVADPYALGLATFTAGLAAYLEGSWLEALGEFEQAAEILRERCRGVAWEIDNTELYSLMALYQLGRIGELLRRLPVQLEEARERGDLYALTNTRTRVAWLADLAADDPERARAGLDEALAHWPQQGFHLQHVWALVGQTEAALYRDEGRGSWERLTERWGALRKSLLLAIPTVFVDCHSVRARAALAAAGARGGAEAAKLVKAAERDARRIARRHAPWSNAVAELILAGVAAARGLQEQAASRAGAAEEGFTKADMALHAAVARRRRGELVGGDEGRRLCESADAWMAAQGIRDPQKIAAQMAPLYSPPSNGR